MNSLPYDQCGCPTGSPLEAYASSICSEVMTSIWLAYVSSLKSAATFAMAASYFSRSSRSQSAPVLMGVMGPPRSRTSDVRCPPRGRSDRLGAALRRSRSRMGLFPEQFAEHGIDLLAARRALHRERLRLLREALVF